MRIYYTMNICMLLLYITYIRKCNDEKQPFPALKHSHVFFFLSILVSVVEQKLQQQQQKQHQQRYQMQYKK